MRPCWYRAFVETAAGTRVQSAADIESLCGGLEGLQRQACVTGASVIGPPDPRNQLAICASLQTDTDIAACIRGTKVQNLLQYPDDMKVDLIKDCKQFDGSMALDVLPLAGQDARRRQRRQARSSTAAPSSRRARRAKRAWPA